ncbi:unnamed protein product [Rotaria sp. Silwood1]|nr:unnamed protein product [Rotaria sp. Silwood1]CAF3607891.1 unnamed protein product [Rotaria sp. Silwood1]CAF3668881.1 unnamed protein product [Rotaria sp. Silwood1]CAF4664802.1 unnamed protein product [Rotaria sp. Silwood1]CAF4687403.1 unnamed protein product [Rotaria sp. Silwood1]
MFLFRPSNNNQLFVALSQCNSNDERTDDDTEEVATNQTNASKNNKESLETLDHGENVSDNGIEDALTWVVHQIPTSIADQELQASDSDDKIFTTKLEQSTM